MEPGDVGEDRLAALGVPQGAAGEVSADGDAHHQRAPKGAVRSPPCGGRLAAQLLHGGPDVVEELDLGTGPQAADGLAHTAADDVGFRQRRVVAAGRAESTLQPAGDAEDPTLALYVVEDVVIGVGHVLAEDPDALVLLPSARCRVSRMASAMTTGSVP